MDAATKIGRRTCPPMIKKRKKVSVAGVNRIALVHWFGEAARDYLAIKCLESAAQEVGAKRNQEGGKQLCLLKQSSRSPRRYPYRK